MRELEKAKKCLQSGDYTCVLCKADKLYTSTDRGVKPLVKWLASDCDFKGYYAADKVIGKATAFLYVLLGIQEVYAGVISRTALEVFVAHGIHVEYETVVTYIKDRSGDGICPFEAAVLDIEETEKAYEAIRLKMTEMNIIISEN